jgi:hypothetical protein
VRNIKKLCFFVDILILIRYNNGTTKVEYQPGVLQYLIDMRGALQSLKKASIQGGTGREPHPE